jgi:hypothetical protein
VAQSPQCASSFDVSTHAPSQTMPVAQPQTPWVHTPSVGHCTPQPPQFRASLVVSRQMPPQGERPAAQWSPASTAASPPGAAPESGTGPPASAPPAPPAPPPPRASAPASGGGRLPASLVGGVPASGDVQSAPGGHVTSARGARLVPQPARLVTSIAAASVAPHERRATRTRETSDVAIMRKVMRCTERPRSRPTGPQETRFSNLAPRPPGPLRTLLVTARSPALRSPPPSHGGT